MGRPRDGGCEPYRKGGVDVSPKMCYHRTNVDTQSSKDGRSSVAGLNEGEGGEQARIYFGQETRNVTQ